MRHLFIDDNCIPPASPVPSGHSAPQPSYVGGKQHHPHIQTSQAGMAMEPQPQQGPTRLMVGADAQVSKVGAKAQVPAPEQHTDNLLDLLRSVKLIRIGTRFHFNESEIATNSN